MDFEREAHAQYQKAHSIAMINQSKDKKQRVARYPIALDAFLDDRMISCRLDLGVMEIPVNLIVGVAELNEANQMYTRDFLPIEDPNSEFAAKWRSVYQKFVADQNSSEIYCLEYLGRFYVLDGLMDVSVAKFYGADIIKSYIIRMMPVKNESASVKRYFDFLVHFHLTNLYQLQFTQPGYFEKLQSALDKEVTMKWSDSDRTSFLTHWPKIERAFQSSFDNGLNITPADALVILLEKYSYSQLIRMDSWVLARIFQTCWKDLYQLSYANRIESEMKGATLHTA